MNISALLVMTAGANAKSPAVAYADFYVGKALYHTVTCDLASGTLSTKTVHSQHLTSVWNLIAQEQPVVAITGTFFGLKTQVPVADVLVNGKLVAFGDRGTAFGVDWYGGVSIFDRPHLQPVDWTEFQFGIRGAVRVVNGGVVRPNPQAQAFHDSAIWGKAARTAVGLTKSGKLMFFATTSKVTLSELGRAMTSKGIRNGVSLDGGTSTCLYYNGSMVIPPGRQLSNLIVVTRKSLNSF